MYLKEWTEESRARAQLFSAVIAETPVERTDLVHVLIPQFDDDTPHRYGPCKWGPQDTAYPSAGDSAIVAVTDQGEYWILNWFPA